MPPLKHYQLVVLSSDSELSEPGGGFAGADLSPFKPLTLRQKEPPTPNQSSQRSFQSPVPASASKKAISSKGSESCSHEDIPLDHHIGEADDEAEDGPTRRDTEKTSRTVRRLFPTSHQSSARRSTVESRPKGRFWLDTVEIPAHQNLYTNGSKSNMARPKKHPPSNPSPASRQTTIASYFTIRRRSHHTEQGSSPPGQMAQDEPTTQPAEHVDNSEVDVNASSTSSHLRSTVQPAQVALSVTSSDPAIVSDPDDARGSSRSISYVDLVNDTDTDSYKDDEPDQSSESSSDGSQKDESSEEHESSEEEVIGPKRKRGNAQLSSFFSNQRSVGDAPKPAARKSMGGPQEESRNRDGWTYKLGIDTTLAPLHDIDEIFSDLTSKARKLGLESALKHIGGRNLRVATMCSGTESPLLALDLIGESLKKQKSIPLTVDHQFSAEIVPFKQAYIERNFSPPIIFRDIRELVTCEEKVMNTENLKKSVQATTAYGSMAAIPGDIDLLVAGFSCVDFSNLNVSKQKIEGTGESGDTFRAVYAYARTWRPTLIVLENVCSAPWGTIQKTWADAEYAAHFTKVDTKHYYIPHTRQRGYMICIDQRKFKNAGAMVKKWAKVVDELRRPASSSIEAFLLDEDDPRVHRGREEMTKGIPGDDRGPREVDWTKCQGRHQDYRTDLFLGSKRPMTGWADNGSCKMPDYAWADWGVKQVERIWDTLEISQLRNARRGYDSQYKTRVWELSQNIDRFTDTTPFGITGCITPTGYPYITNRGGPMIGLEALSMQGLPIEKLLLTRENQKQLQDLAGNAMSSTVVGAAIIGALIVGYEALQKGNPQEVVVELPQDVTDHIRMEDELRTCDLDLEQHSIMPVASLLKLAHQSSRLCLCEGRALITSRGLQRCKKCGHTTCLKCGGNPVHDYEHVKQEEVNLRIAPTSFEDKLKDALPMRLALVGLTVESLNQLKSKSGVQVPLEDWNLLTKALGRALGAELRFHALKRAQAWTALYDSPDLRLELILQPTQAEWRVFAKPAPSEPGASKTRRLLERPFARMRPTGDNLLDGKWQFCFPVVPSFNINIRGNGKLTRSWESKLGLQEPPFAEKQVWTKLGVTVNPTDLQHLDIDISGEYDLLENCGTASGSLHKRHGSVPLFLFLDPTRLGDPKSDHFVFSTDIRRLNYGETRQTVAHLDASWRPSATDKIVVVKCQVPGVWTECEAKLQPVTPTSKATFDTPSSNFQVDFSESSCDAARALLSCHVPLSGEETTGWTKGPWVEVGKVNEQAFYRSFAWLTERVRRITGLDDWREFNLPKDLSRCQQCAPDSPPVKWKIQSGKLTPYEDPQKAGPYERTLKNRPAPFITQVRIDEANVGHLRIGLNILSLAHRALANLSVKEGRSSLAASWRLVTDFVAFSRIPVPKFSLKSNKHDLTCAKPPNFKLKLRPEQLRSLKWMQDQESEQAPSFAEEEIEEAILPDLGWRAEAKATKNVFIRGGVLADQVGYGKTAITLGLIDAQFEKDGKWTPKTIPGKIAIKATLIVVPGQLVNQWTNEVTKFLGTRYRVISIKTQADLTKTSVRDFEAADMIIVTWSLFNNETYLNRVAHFAALPEMPSASAGRAFDAWFDFAVDRLAEHVDLLRDEGAEIFQRTLKARLESTENDEDLRGYIPSKRLRGAAYRAANGGKSNNGGPQKKKRKTNHALLTDDDVDDSPAPKSATKRKNEGEVFGFSSAAVKRDWTYMKCPLFQMFRFNRLVVDEYTYVDGKNHTCITQIDANSRWVLSGTPPLGDFADVKTIAVFLGIHLGIDDDTSTVVKAQNIKMMQKNRTDVEKFQAFKQARSSAWHRRRHELAQQFLDQFVRQNIAEIDEIPFEEHLRPIVLPAAERAIYMELNQHLMAQDMRIRKGRAKLDNDRERRLNQVLGESKSPEEALLKRCSHFTLEALTKEKENAMKACEIVVKEREEQYTDLIRDLRKSLKRAVLLKNDCEGRSGHYDGWKDNVSKNVFGDLEATQVLRQMISDATDEYSSSSSKNKKGKTSKSRPERSQDEDDEDPDAGLNTTAEKAQALRNLAGHLRRLSTELVSRTRSLRFFDVVRQLQLARSGVATSDVGQICSRCKREAPPDVLSVLTVCGHTACKPCIDDYQRSEECIVIGCNAPARVFNVVKAEELGEEDRAAGVGRHYGRKLEAVISLIKKEIPKEEQVILFVQFDDLMHKVSEALTENGVSHHCLEKSARGKGAWMMSDFQENQTSKKMKVLMLNVSDESASGANLTNANHIIFLSPLLVPNQYQYDSATTQAIGRARRYGQRKTVHIYRFLSLKTIDVDIIEERTGKMLLKENGQFILRKVTDAERKDLKGFGGGAVRSQIFSDSD